MKKTNVSKEQGFTLIEILVVIGIIAVLAAIVLVAINPALRFAQAQNNQRSSNLTAILDAAGQYIVDNQGDASGLGLPTTESDITEALCDELVNDYLAGMPTDPDGDLGGATVTCADITATETTGYTIFEDNGRITVCAPEAEFETAIQDDPDTPVVEPAKICVSR